MMTGGLLLVLWGMQIIEAGDVVPIEAWVQAAIVVLFAILLLAFLAEIRKNQTAWQDFLNKRDEQMRAFLDTQNGQWQSFLRLQNEQMRHDIAEQYTSTCEAIKDMAEAINTLRSQLIQHDQRVDERIERAERSGSEVKTKPLDEKTRSNGRLR